MTILHLVSHTHWDREWYRTFQQFRLRLIHLIDGVLHLLDSDRDFRFFMLDGQTIVLDDYLLMRPENEEKIRRYVQSGRLIIGPWHILPDEFLVSPEATIRNLLEGERTCLHFGARMNVGYIPDPFGHIGQMPQILQGFGMETACVQRGLSDERCEFWWQAPDGSRVLMAYLRDGYGNAAGLPAADSAQFTAEVRRLRDSLLPQSNSGQHLLLMCGTDHMEPHPATANAIAATKGKLDGDKLIHSTLEKYITAMRKSLRQVHLPTVQGELRDCKRSHLLPGVLSTRMWIKQRNHACESLLEKWVEPFTTFAARAGAGLPTSIFKPAGIIRQTWRLLMECHPHDSICGCSIDQVHDEMKIRFDQVEQVGKELVQQSLERLAENVRTAVHDPASAASAESALVVFNPSSFARTDLVEATVESQTAFDLRDEKGASIPYQSRGLGSQELIHARLSPKELQGMYTAIHDGQVMGLSILEIEITRQGEVVLINAWVSEKQKPNPAAWQRGVAEIDALIADPLVKEFSARVFSLDSARICFRADQVPALGWKTYTIHPRPQADGKPVRISALARLLLPLAKSAIAQRLALSLTKKRGQRRMENDLFSVEADKEGTLIVTELKSGHKYQGLNRFLDGGDCGDLYNYCPPVNDTLIKARCKRVSVIKGSTSSVMEIDYAISIPVSLTADRKGRARSRPVTRITSRVTIANGIPRLDIHTTVQNNADDHRLRVHFPAGFVVEKAAHDGHFEVVERRLGVPPSDDTWVEKPRPEVPQRVFTSIANDQHRLTIANRGLPEVEVLQTGEAGSEIALTLLRCIGWLSRDDLSNRRGHAGPSLATPGAQLAGTWEFDYAIVIETGEIESRQQSHAFNTPLQGISTRIHPGTLPPSGSFVEVKPGEFLVSTIKEAEDGNGWVLRGYNQSGQDIVVTLKLWHGAKRAERITLNEKRLKALNFNSDGSLTFPVKAHEIATIRFPD